MRTAVFIDGAYLNRIMLDEYGGRQLDYTKLSVELAQGKELLRTYYYDAPPWQSNPPTEEERKRFAARQKFFSTLRKLPKYDVREGRCQRVWDRNANAWKYMQKRVDVLFSVDLVSLASKGKITTAVIVTGDSDFLPAVEVAKNEGVSIVLLHAQDRKRVHRDLWEHVDERIAVDAALIAKVSV